MAKRLIHGRLAYKVGWRLKSFTIQLIRKKSLRETLESCHSAIRIGRGSRYWSMLYSCHSLGAVYYLFTAYTERAFLPSPRLFKHPLTIPTIYYSETSITREHNIIDTSILLTYCLNLGLC